MGRSGPILDLGVRRSVLAAEGTGRKDEMVAAESGMVIESGGFGCGDKEAVGLVEEAEVGSASGGGKNEAAVESIVLFGVVGGGSIAVCIRTEDG